MLNTFLAWSTLQNWCTFSIRSHLKVKYSSGVEYFEDDENFVRMDNFSGTECCSGVKIWSNLYGVLFGCSELFICEIAFKRGVFLE